MHLKIGIIFAQNEKKTEGDRGLSYSDRSVRVSAMDFDMTFAVFCIWGKSHLKELNSISISNLNSIYDWTLQINNGINHKSQLRNKNWLNIKNTSIIPNCNYKGWIKRNIQILFPNNNYK